MGACRNEKDATVAADDIETKGARSVTTLRIEVGIWTVDMSVVVCVLLTRKRIHTGYIVCGRIGRMTEDKQEMTSRSAFRS